MYLDFFRLKAEPFGITPDPDFLFLSPSHKEALASIVYGVRMRKGFVAVTGEAGVGKTTVIRSYLDSLDSRSVKVVYLFNSNVAFPALLRTIFRELGLEAGPGGVSEMIDRLHSELIELYKTNVNVVLIIDEAQNMPVATLENLRMLSNLETTKEKLIQIIFSGQPEFDRLLERTDLRQLRQRIAVRVSIKRLSGQESRDYIRHRLVRASAGGRIFTGAAVRAIAGRAKGIPRTINILCGNALITAFGYNRKTIGYFVASEVSSDLEPGRKHSPALVYAVAVAVALLAFVAAYRFVPAALAKLSSAKAVKAPAVSALPHPQQESARPAVSVQAPALSAAPAKPAPAGTGLAAPSGVSRANTEHATEVRREAVNRVVGKGDTLSSLAINVYGYSNDEIIGRVARNNPGIRDVNVIYEGDRISFPAN